MAATLGSTVVLFGGMTGPAVNETWTWDGKDWTQLAPKTAPDPRQSVGLATLGNRLVLFGGWDGAATYYDDTWFFDGTEWSPASTVGPSFRAFVAMCGP
jgi:hypothetical protein